MQSRVAQYLNEIVSLTVMALLIMALAAGETAAGTDLQAEISTTLAAGDDFGFRHQGE